MLINNYRYLAFSVIAYKDHNEEFFYSLFSNSNRISLY